MKAIVLKTHGKPSVLKISNIPEPIPGLGEVLVQIQTIGLNYAEILSRKGQYGWAPKLPYVLGMEAYGEIEAIGAGITNHRIGEKVVVGTQYGAYAEKIVIPETQALPAIDNYSPEENAAFVVNYMTAWVSLFEMARIRPSDAVLVQAAAGGVGSAAVQLAKYYGCTVYGTAGSDHKLELLKQLNIDAAINYRKQDFEQELKNLNDYNGVDVVLEVVGGEVYRKSLRILNPLGRIVVAGFASINLQKWNPLSVIKTLRDMPRADIRKMAENSYGVMASHLGYLLKKPQLMQRIWRDLVTFVTEKQIHPIVGHRFQFEEMAAAHELMESRKSHGKIVVELTHNQ